MVLILTCRPPFTRTLSPNRMTTMQMTSITTRKSTSVANKPSSRSCREGPGHTDTPQHQEYRLHHHPAASRIIGTFQLIEPVQVRVHHVPQKNQRSGRVLLIYTCPILLIRLNYTSVLNRRRGDTDRVCPPSLCIDLHAPCQAPLPPCRASKL